MKKFINFDTPLTQEQIAELKALEEMSDDDIIYDDEFPELTDKELSEFRRVTPLSEIRQVANA